MLLVLAIAAAWFWLPRGWGVAAVVVAGAFEVAEAAFWIWLSKRRRPTTGAEALEGSVAVAVTACEPTGHVRLDGELWSAHCPEGAQAGDRVVVERLGPDLTLLVHPEPSNSPK